MRVCCGWECTVAAGKTTVEFGARALSGLVAPLSSARRAGYGRKGISLGTPALSGVREMQLAMLGVCVPVFEHVAPFCKCVAMCRYGSEAEAVRNVQSLRFCGRPPSHGDRELYCAAAHGRDSGHEGGACYLVPTWDSALRQVAVLRCSFGMRFCDRWGLFHTSTALGEAL